MSKLVLSQLLITLAALAGCGSSKPAPKAPPVEAKPAPVVVAPPPEAKVDDSAQLLAAAALAEQYGTGKEIYVKACASCHGDDGLGNPKNPPVLGKDALPEAAPAKAKLRKGVKFTTAQDVFTFIKAKMPLKKAGSLTDDEYYAVLAWDLNENKVALDHKLDATTAPTIKLR